MIGAQQNRYTTFNGLEIILALFKCLIQQKKPHHPDVAKINI